MNYQQKLISEIEKDCQKLGMTYAELCKAAGITTATFWRWRTGKGSPMVSNLERIRAVLDKPQLVRGRATRKSVTGA